MRERRRRIAVSLLTATLALAGCSTGGGVTGVPSDGRMIDRVAFEPFEYGVMAVGRDRDLNLRRSDGLGLVYAPALSVYLNSVMSRLVAVSPIENAPVRVFLQATPQWGASTSADANVYLNLGLLMELENEDELAAVLAHELSHVVLRHHSSDVMESSQKNAVTATQMAQVVEMGLLVGGVMDAPVVNGNALVENNGDILKLSTMVISPGWTRRQETEADILGTDLLIAAGYNKVAMLTILDKQRAYEKSVAAAEAEAEDAAAPSRKERDRTINLGGVRVGLSVGEMLGPLARKHRKAEDRSETVQAYINREYRRAPRPRIRGAQWDVIVEGGTTRVLLDSYAHAFDAEQRLVAGDVDGAVEHLQHTVVGPTKTHAYPRFLIAQARLQRGDRENALRDLEIAFTNPEPSVRVFQTASAVHAADGRAPQALAVLERAYEIFDATPALTPDLAAAYRMADRGGDARRIVKRCKREYPSLEDMCDADDGTGFRFKVSSR